MKEDMKPERQNNDHTDLLEPAYFRSLDSRDQGLVAYAYTTVAPDLIPESRRDDVEKAFMESQMPMDPMDPYYRAREVIDHIARGARKYFYSGRSTIETGNYLLTKLREDENPFINQVIKKSYELAEKFYSKDYPGTKIITPEEGTLGLWMTTDGSPVNLENPPRNEVALKEILEAV